MIQMQRECNSSVESIDCPSQGVECVLHRNREKAQISDLKRIIESFGTVDLNAISEFEAIYKWYNVFNELD